MSAAAGAAPTSLLLTCEHASNRIPPPYQRLFRGAGDVLASHRGWDPGALPLARLLARHLRRPLLQASWSRLLVESNRAPHNPRIWSRYTAPLARSERERILDRYWWPHRRRVDEAVAAAVARGERVVHVAVHSFTPELDGEVRTSDVSFLYDSKRRQEGALCRRWAERLRRLAPELRVRFNYPYLGVGDGLPTWLRRRHPPALYLGIELEANQALLAAPGWRKAGQALALSLEPLLTPPGR
jgi:predicted N-formylglutamate amidohydrolase